MMKTILKENKGSLILTSASTLLPLLAGLLLWDTLPDVLVTHWGMDNEPNGYMSKAAVVFGLPLFMLAIQWFCILVTSLDKKNAANQRVMKLMWWIIPVVSVLCGVITYAYALEIPLNVGFAVTAVVGLVFAAVGFILPRCQQNSTVGVRLPWTLASEDNWNKTHRLAGGIWVAGGLLITVTSPLANMWVMLGILLVMVLIPCVYSFWYAKQED